MNNDNDDVRVSDVVQVMRGADSSLFGIVMEILRHGQEYKCWLRQPIDQGGQSITFRVKAADCIKIGRCKMRPTLPGDKQKQPIQARPASPIVAAVAPTVDAKSAQVGASSPVEVDAEALPVAVFKGPSAFDAHNLKPPERRAPAGDPLVQAQPPQRRKRGITRKGKE